MDIASRSNHQGPTALLLGNYRPALAVARGLAADGYHIILGSEGDEGGCELSKFVADVWDHPSLDKGEAAFLKNLNHFLAQRHDITVVFPVAEEFVNLFANSHWLAPDGVTLVGPECATVTAFSDKVEALKLARQLDIPTLPFELVRDHTSLFAAACRIGFPLTVRPIGTTARIGHKKALIVATPEALKHALPEWPGGHLVLLLQHFAIGKRHNIYFAAWDGELLGVVESRIRRTNHPEGTGLAVFGETIAPSPALVGDTQKLVSQCDYTGIGLVQFIVDPATGDRCFLELNPRVSGSHAVPEYAGMPLTTMAVALARGVKIKTTRPQIQSRTGLRYAWASGALVGAKLAYIRGEIGVIEALSWVLETLLAAVSADAHLVWSWDDPKPGLRALINILPKFTRARALLGSFLPKRRSSLRPAHHAQSRKFT